ncbi:MAG: methyltransferase domain-containing protein, partial [Nitrososphaerales archaeon]
MVSKETQTVLPVPRTKEEAKWLYDRISRLYEYLAGLERKYAEMALDRLSVQNGETVLEIGFGSGHCLKRIAKLVGESGKACGLDISSGMLEVTRGRLGQAGLIDRIELYQGDAANLPFRDNAFDTVFTSFTLELFDTPEIPKVLQEIRRALRPKGKLGVIDASKENGGSLSMRLYEWAHM